MLSLRFAIAGHFAGTCWEVTVCSPSNYDRHAYKCLQMRCLSGVSWCSQWTDIYRRLSAMKIWLYKCLQMRCLPGVSWCSQWTDIYRRLSAMKIWLYKRLQMRCLSGVSWCSQWTDIYRWLSVMKTWLYKWLKSSGFRFCFSYFRTILHQICRHLIVNFCLVLLFCYICKQKLLWKYRLCTR
jgi:hypothetical protein